MRSLSGVLLGCLSGPRAFWRFFGLSRYFGGVRLLAPSEAPFLDARRQGCSDRFFLLLFSPCCVCGFFTRTRRGGPVVIRGIPPGRRTHPAGLRPSEGPGSAVERACLDTGVLGTFSDSLCLAEGYRDPGTIFGGRGRALPSQVLFSHALFGSRPRFLLFFCWPLRPRMD